MSSLVFRPFRLEPRGAQLYRDTEVIPLRPKTYALLHQLVTHPGELLAKDTLLESVWPGLVIAEGGLSELVRELRKLLGDDPKTPRFIETVHGRGYRFIAEVTSLPRAPRPLTAPARAAAPGEAMPVGRDAEIAALESRLARARTGTRQIVFVTGEPGIGKTTVLEAFGRKLADQTPSAPWCVKGQCIEQYGAGEAYLPILDALGRLARQADTNILVDVLQRCAPTWLVQLPSLLDEAALATLQARVLGQTRERMLREMAEALETLCAIHPLVLMLEDLHWSDYSTLDLLSFVAQRDEPAALMIVATYRPVEVYTRDHPLKAIKQQLELRGRCAELALPCLGPAAISEYLARRFEGSIKGPPSLAELARMVHRRTDGHPLFMVNVADYVATQGPHAVQDAIEQRIPESVRQMIELQVARLTEDDQQLLETASVAGTEFSAASLAEGLGTGDLDAVERRCATLAARAQFLQSRGAGEWPDGTLAARFGFIHALYQNVLYHRVTPGRRARLHQRIGLREEAAYGAETPEIAAELALHFEEGRDYPRAVYYLRLAGERAVRRCANREAIELFTHGLDLAQLIGDVAARRRQEFLLCISLGPPLIHSRGYAADDVREVYERARALHADVGAPEELFPVLWGLWLYHVVRGDHARAYQLGLDLCALETRVGHPFPWAHYATGCSLFWLGRLEEAAHALDRAVDGYDRARDQLRLPTYSQDPRVVSLLYRAWVWWFTGHPDKAVRTSLDAVDSARAMAHPFSLAFAWNYAAEVRQLRGEPAATASCADAAIDVSAAQDFPFWLAWGRMMKGCAIARGGDGERGIAMLREGLSAYEATGAGMGKTLFLAMLADACLHADRTAAGLEAIAQAFAFMQASAEHAYTAELHRLAGELTLRADPAAVADATGRFHTALEIARRQGARSWALRAALSLA
ncbi:MAG: AAA family ATPase, partial [Gammaproteobacteria bacterium]